MNDFSKVLNEMVVHGRGPNRRVDESELSSGASNAAGTKLNMRTLMGHFNNLQDLTKNLIGKFNEKMETVDAELAPLLDEVKRKMGGIAKTFSGLKHLTQEQQAHIKKVTGSANARIKELKGMVDQLEKAATNSKSTSDERVMSLSEKVSDLEEQLKLKDIEMESQRQDYEEVLDYYEEIMVKMKKSEMQAKRALRELEKEMSTEFDGLDWYTPAPKQPGKNISKKAITEWKELLEEQLVESSKHRHKPRVKTPTKLDIAAAFDLTEHLKKAYTKNNGDKSSYFW